LASTAALAQAWYAIEPPIAAAGHSSVAVTGDVADDSGQAMAASLTDPALKMFPSTTTGLGSCFVGSSFSATLTTTGGTGTVTFAVTAGSLPRGVALSQSGVFSGTPDRAATSTFTVTATDSESPTRETAQRSYVVTCLAASTDQHAYFAALTDTRNYPDCTGADSGASPANCRIQLHRCHGDNGACSLRSQEQIDLLSERNDEAIATSSSSGGIVTVKLAQHSAACDVGQKITIAEHVNAAGGGSSALNGEHVITGVVSTTADIQSSTGGTFTPTVTTRTAHRMSTGDVVTIRDSEESQLNNEMPITVTGATTFTVPIPHQRLASPAKVRPVTKGTIQVTGVFQVAGATPPGKGGTAGCWDWEYDPSRDTHPASSKPSGPIDGVKMTLSPLQASVSKPVSFTADLDGHPWTMTTGSFLTVKDVLYSREFRVPECGGNQLDDNWKAYMQAETTGTRFFETRHSWTEGMRVAGEGTACVDPTKVGALNLRTYTVGRSPDNHHLLPSEEGPGASVWGLTQEGNAITPTGQGALRNFGYVVTMETWTRLIVLIEHRVRYDDPRLNAWKAACNTAGGPTSGHPCANIPSGIDPGTGLLWEFTLYSLWACDEARPCQRVYFRMPWYADANYRMLDQLRANTSSPPFNRTGPVYAWFRNVVAIRNPALSLTGTTSADDIVRNPSIFQQPRR